MQIVVVSGYFNPLHSGHLDLLEGAALLGDHLVAIVNNDFQVGLKGSQPFMRIEERLRIVRAIGCVDRAVKSVDLDGSVVLTLETLLLAYSSDYEFSGMTFANGGDRHPNETPEEVFCAENGIGTEFSVGGGKTQSSSSLLKGYDGLD